MKVKIGFIQSPLQKDRGKMIQDLIEEAIEKNCDIVALPEMWLTGFSFTEEDEKKAAEFLHRVRELSRKADTLIIPGTLPEREQGRLYNTAYAIHRGGIVHKRRKLFLFEPMGESEIFSPGDPPSAFQFKSLRIAIAICYELRFPAIFDRIIRSKADLIIIPAQWPNTREEHWRTLLRGRALETQAFVVGINVVGKTKKLSFSGFSAVIHPLGYPIIEASHTEGLFICDIETEEAKPYREQVPVIRDTITHGNI